MNSKSLIVCLVAALLSGPTLVLAAEPSADTSSAAQSVKDSSITSAVKARLAANGLANLMQLTVDTDGDGVVWLGGTARTQDAADHAVEIARTTDGVNYVKSTIEVTRTAK